MITLDVTDTEFLNTIKVDVANEWMSKNVGELIHDDSELTYGVGWKLVWEPDCQRWVMMFENDKHASLFLLRWS
jgi:hypothetical protein